MLLNIIDRVPRHLQDFTQQRCNQRIGSRLTGNIRWVARSEFNRRLDTAIGLGTTIQWDQILVTDTTIVGTKFRLSLWL